MPERSHNYAMRTLCTGKGRSMKCHVVAALVADAVWNFDVGKHVEKIPVI